MGACWEGLHPGRGNLVFLEEDYAHDRLVQDPGPGPRDHAGDHDHLEGPLMVKAHAEDEADYRWGLGGVHDLLGLVVPVDDAGDMENLRRALIHSAVRLAVYHKVEVTRTWVVREVEPAHPLEVLSHQKNVEDLDSEEVHLGL